MNTLFFQQTIPNLREETTDALQGLHVVSGSRVGGDTHLEVATAQPGSLSL